MFPWLVFLKEGEEDDMSDHYIGIGYYRGNDNTNLGAFPMLGYNDADTVKKLFHFAAITEGNANSVHEQTHTTILTGISDI